MWQKWMMRVRGVMACSILAASSACPPGAGTGKEIFVSLMPSRRTRWSHVVSMRP